MAPKAKTAAASVIETSSVSDKILSEFLDAVSDDSDLSGVGERLRKAMLEKHDLSDSSLRQALFGDASL